ncbi:uncharacterized protein K02A2.6-like [Macrosteles quadrilineatus]|uniref:uncharacterized protein K02A2.6-like n=1 Tax=Macrosteles quadrilineatus TaxID=74068 RepID=UPI0023E1105D|nr:uncharacterized protein K02A2.6-like [Macrosteles quadrilineatus]
MSSDEVTVRLSSLRTYWNRFENAQSELESLVDEEDIEQLATSRSEIEELYITTEVVLRKKLQSPTTVTNQSSVGLHPSVTSNIAFVPFDEGESFTNFVKRFENFISLKEISDDKTKLCTLLAVLPPKLHEQLQDLVSPDDPYKMNYKNVVTVLKDYLEPLPSVISLQHKFLCHVQQDESTMDFSMELKRLAKDCRFQCECGKSVSDMLLRMQFVRGLKDNDVRGQLLQKETSTFKESVQAAISFESSRLESSIISNPTTAAVLKLTGSTERKMPQQQQYASKGPTKKTERYHTVRSTFDQLRGRCYRCGDKFHKADSCRYKDEFCNSCNKVGHLARVCMAKNRTKYINQIEDSENVSDIDHATYDTYKIQMNGSDKFMVEVTLEGKPIQMELDTGAALSSISYKDYKKLNLSKKLFQTHVQLRTYTGELIKPKGVVYVEFNFKDKAYFGKLYVIGQNVEPIFGREWLREINLKIGDIRTIQENSCDLSKLLTEFSDVFKKEIGCIPNEKVHLSLQEGCKPIFIKPRQVPYSLKGKVEDELNRLENAGIITKVNNAQWGNPIVPVVKPNGSVRICADYKTTLNKVIQDDKHPIPRIEDIFAEMNGGKLFCTLDISNAYLHMQMDEESSNMQTISTEKGLYKVNRMMFGVKVAPSVWQRFMDRILQGISGVKCFFDDIIIQGSNYEETVQRLKLVLDKMREHDLRLNFEKCKFFQKRIAYLGHTIDENGLQKGSEKVKAIVEAKRPRDVNQLRSFIGLANYYKKFIPILAEKLNPLNKLLQKGKKFEWTDECERSFESVKMDIAKDKTLIHYNPSLPLILSTDASPTGLGAVISHRLNDGTEKPIAFASRSLSKSENQYSQIDKEATAIYWGVKKFFPYCYGRKFILVTDHKPLVSIFHPSKSLPAMSATRLLNYALFLAGFDYKIEYRKTSDHSNADFLSRFPVEKLEEGEDLYSKFQINQISMLPLTKETIAEHTKKDTFFSKVKIALENGDDLETMGLNNNEYTLHKGCVFRGIRVVIPSSLQKEVLKELHVGHLGMTKMKAMARSYLYWKNVDRDIEELVRNCKICSQKRNEPPKDRNHPWEEPSGPWERIHLDFLGPMNGNYFLVIIDAHTKWLEILHTKSTTAEWCIKKLQHLFTTFGLPVTVVTDNGTQFTSTAFQNYLKENGICHRTCAPFHPSSNGQAERFVQTVKKGLNSMVGERGDIQTKIDALVTQLRKAPSSTTGMSAYKMMFGRDIRTKLNVMSDKTEWFRVEQRKIGRQFSVGQKVQARNYASKEKWRLGEIISRVGNVMYRIKMDNGLIWTRHTDQILPKN